MGVIRRLVTELELRSATALKGLVAYGRTWQTIEKVVANSAAAIERNADRAAAAMARMADGAAAVRASGGGSGGGGGGRRGGGGRGPDPAAVATRQQKADQAARRREEANEQRADVAARRLEEKRQKEAERATAKRARAKPGADPLDGIMAGAGRSAARQGGLADGAKAIRDATAALGPFSTKSDRAKAAASDLAAQVARNRKEMADLKAEVVRSGDASGTLKARMQGLAVATSQTSQALQQARSNLRAVDGGLIDTIKNAANLSNRFGVLKIAAGHLISAGIQRGFAAVGGAMIYFTVDQGPTAGTTCTAVTIRPYDSGNAALPAQVTSTANCTTDPTSAWTWSSCSISTEETLTQPGGQTQVCYESQRAPDANPQPIILREGEGLGLKQTALAGAGTVGLWITFGR